MEDKNSTQVNQAEFEQKTFWQNIDTQKLIMTGFVKCYNKILHAIIIELDFTCLAIYLLLLSHRNTTTNDCFPTIDTLAYESNCSKSTILRSIKKLSDAGYVHVLSGKQKRASAYFFPFEDFYKPELEEAAIKKAESRGLKLTKKNPELKTKNSEPQPQDSESQDSEQAPKAKSSKKTPKSSTPKTSSAQAVSSAQTVKPAAKSAPAAKTTTKLTAASPKGFDDFDDFNF